MFDLIIKYITDIIDNISEKEREILIELDELNL